MHRLRRLLHRGAGLRVGEQGEIEVLAAAIHMDAEQFEKSTYA